MAKNRDKYVHKIKKQPVFFIFKSIFKLFIHKPKVINLNDEYPKTGLIITDHRGKWGPFFMSIHSPFPVAFIGASPMLGNYKERYLYLRNILYIQKLKKGKVYASVKAAFEAIFSKMIYKGMRLIPSYADMRFVKTISYVQKTMNNNLPVVVFPEDSDEGYFDELKVLRSGFIIIAETISRREKKDIPIYPVYEHLKKKLIIIDKPFYLSQFKDKTKEEICEYAKNRINNLYKTYVKSK